MKEKKKQLKGGSVCGVAYETTGITYFSWGLPHKGYSKWSHSCRVKEQKNQSNCKLMKRAIKLELLSFQCNS